MGIWLIALLVFVGVAAIVGGASLLLHDKSGNKLEDRLSLLTGAGGTATGKDAKSQESSILSHPLDDTVGMIEAFIERFGNLSILFEQADTNLTISKLAAISLALAAFGGIMGGLLGIHPGLVPLMSILLGLLPLGWLLFRRSRRLKAFAAQLPDGLEMLARSLRSGQSLGFGFNMVASEMPAPISKEFNRVFEEQNLGIPLDESLNSLTQRIPNLDLKFFVTAVILQRQTGGDLAEILDKIGELIRDRFRIWGQIQALTGEGRLSGAVLLGLPFVLFITVYQMNPDYIKVLFTDPMGKQMLAMALFLQVVGALVIKKIINIKV
jgi:tight adherence protein B